MTSFNHYALGAVADFLHRRVAGLASATPGYRELLVRPLPGTPLTFASARHVTPYGEAMVAWRRADGQLTLRVRVPVGSTATVHVPGRPEPVVVRHGEHNWTVDDPCAASTAPPATIRDLLDDGELWPAVVAACAASGVADDDVDAAERLAPYLDAPANRLTAALTADGFVPGAEALATRLRDVLPAGETGR
jgi:alpha-L-rhamnosidase